MRPTPLPRLLAVALLPAILLHTFSLAEDTPAGESDSATATSSETQAATSQPARDPLPDLTGIMVQRLAGRPVTEPSLEQQYTIALDHLISRIGGSGSRDQEEAIELLRAVVLHASRPGNEAGRVACAAAISDALPRSASPEATIQLLRAIALAGDDRSIPAVAGLLAHPSALLQDEARAALASIGTPAAADALGGNLSEQTPPRLAAGIIHSLGRIGRPEDAEQIIPFLESENPVLRGNAADALVAIGGSTAVEALTPLLQSGEGEERKTDTQTAVRLLELAELARGKEDVATASAIYTTLQAAEIPESIRGAALVGQAATAGPEAAIALLRSHLAGEDPVMQEAAVRAASELEPETGVIALLCESVTMVTSPAAAAAILRQLETRNALEALPELRKLAAEGGPEIAPAAIAILGRIGEPADLELLLSLAATEGGPTTPAARKAIDRFRSDEVETILKTQIENESGDPPIRAEAIRAAGRRSHRELLQPILALLSSADPALSAASLEAITLLARPEDIPDLASRLGEPESSAFPRLKVILQKLCQTTSDPNHAAEAIIAATNDAGSDAEAVGIDLLAALGTDSALAHVSKFLGSNTPELRAAAIGSLANWSTFDAADKLLEMLRGSGYSEQEHSVILGGIARLARTPDIAPAEERLALALDALSSTESAGSIMKLISSLATLPSLESAEALEKLLEREDVAREAAAAAIQIAGNLPDNPEGKARQAVLLQQALAVPGLPDSLQEKARKLSGAP